MQTGVIFDLDGVVIDSKAVIASAFGQVFSKYFPTLTPPTASFFAHMGKGLREILGELSLPLVMANDFIECSSRLEHQITVFSGVPELLSDLISADVYVGLATGKERARTLRILHNLDLLKYFSLVVCSDDVPRGKPDPSSLNAHIAYGHLDRNTTYFLGDAQSDIRCAANARVWSVAALWGGMTSPEVLLEEEPAFVARDVADARKLLLGLTRRAKGAELADSWATRPFY